jgi:hypothetical protein
MNQGLVLPRFSIGVGDRFGKQANSQLQACILALNAGVEVVPVWNKSNREHVIIGSDPRATRVAADAAVKELAWTRPYFVDADHIQLKTVERFIEPCDFFTLDVADMIGKPSDAADVDAFLKRHDELAGKVTIPDVDEPFVTDRSYLSGVANNFLAAVKQAGEIYRSLLKSKGEGRFVAEISMDETNAPQTPVELLVVLAMISDEGIPIQTIAPKFTGRFNKGVDYAGELPTFAREFSEDIAAIKHAIIIYGLPANLKLSVHSGSDKFSIYDVIHDAMQSSGAGVHLKTAGTTWLEELIGLAESGGDGLALTKEIYAETYAHANELSVPYATVIAIDPAALPSPAQVSRWTREEFTGALRHDRSNEAYNTSFRQLLHVGFKVAAKMGTRYLEALERNEEVVGRNVTENLFERHIKPVFLGTGGK